MTGPPVIDGLSQLEEVGRGGFSVVYKAEQVELGRTVAIKVLTRAQGAEKGRRMFVRELLALGRLSDHPYIVPIFGSGFATDGVPYIIMAYLGGGTLDQWMGGSPAKWETVVDVAVKLACALQAAHDVGVIHGDVKPSNVLFSQYGQPQLVDFGVAQLMTNAVTQTTSSSWTASHLAPELLHGAKVSTSSDIYSLASTTYTLLLGAPPFVGSPEEPIAAILKRVADSSPPSLDGACPPQIESILRKALSKVPEYRPTTAGEFAQALQDAQRACAALPTPLVLSAIEPSPSRPQAHSRPSLLRRFRQPRWSTPSVIAAGLVAAVVTGATVLWLDTRATRQSLPVAHAKPVPSSPAPVPYVYRPEYVAVAPDGTVFFSDLNRIWEIGSDGKLKSVAGRLGRGFAGDGGLALSAVLNDPLGIGVDAKGQIYIADRGNNRVRIVRTDGTIATFAGNGRSGFTGDGGPAQDAALDEPYDVKVAPDGSVLIADGNNSVVRKVGVDGLIHTILGAQGDPNAITDDGTPALSFGLGTPYSLAFDKSGSLLVLDPSNIWRLGPDGKVRNIAGSGISGHSADNQPATKVNLDAPNGIATDAQGDLFIAETANNKVREITPDGIIHTVVGDGQPNLSPESGSASDAELTRPRAVAVRPDGALVVADSGNSRILLIKAGNVSTLYRFAGTGPNPTVN